MKYKLRVEKAFYEWKNNGSCQEAEALNKSVGSKYFDTANPHW